MLCDRVGSVWAEECLRNVCVGCCVKGNVRTLRRRESNLWSFTHPAGLQPLSLDPNTLSRSPIWLTQCLSLVFQNILETFCSCELHVDGWRRDFSVNLAPKCWLVSTML